MNDQTKKKNSTKSEVLRGTNIYLNLVYSILVIIVMGTIIAYSSVIFASQFKVEEIVKGPGVTGMGHLSDYLPNLENTPGDTAIYYMEGKEPGGTLLIMGGVHPNEPAGLLASILFIENVLVEKGRAIVIPHSNASAFTHQDPGQGAPYSFGIETKWGERRFRYASRVTNPVHQYPDPDAYVHPTGQILSSFEVRNLNRVFPGRPEGMITERIAYAITTLVNEEKVNLVIDCHEARPMNPIVNCIIAADKAMYVAATASITLAMDEDIAIRIEPSPVNLRGLTHREFSDHTDAIAVILETPNPAMDNLRGPTSEELIVEGKDDFFERAAEHVGLIYVPYPEGVGMPLARRTGRHTSGILHLIDAYSELNPDHLIEISNLPRKADIIEHGIGHYLLKP